MRVVEMFTSIEGEGRRAGSLCTFIRLAGCNLTCSYCDTAYAQNASCGAIASVDEIVERVEKISLSSYVTLTGGEPLWRNAEEVDELLAKLTRKGYEVNVETNGSMDTRKFRRPGVFFTIDYKCPTSQCEDKMLMTNFDNAQAQDVVKFVVGSEEDLDAARRVSARMSSFYSDAAIFVSPVFGKIELVEIVEYMKKHAECFKWRMQVQLHKIIWDPATKGV